MTYLDAARAILEAAGEPLTVAEVTARALRKGWISSSGTTPAATMSAALYVEVKHNPTGRLRRVAEPGLLRARRGSVRFVWVGVRGTAK